MVGKAFHFHDVHLHAGQLLNRIIQFLLFVFGQCGPVQAEINRLGCHQLVVIQVLKRGVQFGLRLLSSAVG